MLCICIYLKLKRIRFQFGWYFIYLFFIPDIIFKKKKNYGCSCSYILWSFLLHIFLVTHGKEIDFFTIFLYVSVIIIKIKFKGYWLVFWGMRDLCVTFHFIMWYKMFLFPLKSHYSLVLSWLRKKYYCAVFFSSRRMAVLSNEMRVARHIYYEQIHLAFFIL